jgi:hypothetical protein
MSTNRGWLKACGVLSIPPCIYFWFCLMIAPRLSISCPGSPALLLLSILASIPLSIVAAHYWIKWWYLVTGIAMASLIFVGFKLH